MVGEWGLADWAIVILDAIAIVIVILFLRKKIKSKLKEVELRQDFHLQQKKAASLDEKSNPPRD